MIRNVKIICLCGSTKFKEDFLFLQRQYTLEGSIVLSVGFFGHADNEQLTMETKAKLDILHLAKIELADEIVVITVDKYIGESTRREIEYAKYLGKPVTIKNRMSTLIVGAYNVVPIKHI